MPVFSWIHKWPDMEENRILALSCECLQPNVKSYKSYLDCTALATQKAEQAC